MIRYAFYQNPFGFNKIGYTDGAVVSVSTVKVVDENNEPSPLSDQANTQLQEYFTGQRRTFDFPYEFSGTEFQQRAWQALLNIPYGETRTYKEVASAIGKPGASRAIGMANHHNPLWIVVPCHRVVGTNGKLTGYAGGLEMKQALLDLERGNK